MSNIVIHIPHSSYLIPNEYKKLFYLSDNELFKEQLKMTDSYTDELFDIDRVEKIIFPISRLVCDVERFRDEDKEEMTKRGMWVCYTKTSSLEPLKQVTDKHKHEVLKNYYDVHHDKFENIVEEKLEQYGSCIIIDAHSFSSVTLPYELHSQTFRPDICIGTDDFHTPVSYTEYLNEAFTKSGYSVAINSPFCGTFVPFKYYHNYKRVISIMIEVNRSLYMNEKNGDKTVNFHKIKSDINKFIGELKNVR